MSTTQAQLKTVADESNETTIDLATIVAQTMSTGDLPDWDVYNAACKATLTSVEAAVEAI